MGFTMEDGGLQAPDGSRFVQMGGWEWMGMDAQRRWITVDGGAEGGARSYLPRCCRPSPLPSVSPRRLPRWNR